MALGIPFDEGSGWGFLWIGMLLVSVEGLKFFRPVVALSLRSVWPFPSTSFALTRPNLTPF